MSLTVELVHELFNYHSDGDLTWKVNGCIAGCLDSRGYIVIRIGGKCYKAHRIVWLHVYGSLPENKLDHKNRVRNDNRIENLRIATDTLNSLNRNIAINNKSGVTGVCWHKRDKKWQAMAGRKIIYYGDSFEDAVAVREAWEEELRATGKL